MQYHGACNWSADRCYRQSKLSHLLCALRFSCKRALLLCPFQVQDAAIAACDPPGQLCTRHWVRCYSSQPTTQHAERSRDDDRWGGRSATRKSPEAAYSRVRLFYFSQTRGRMLKPDSTYSQPNMPSREGTMIDWVASLQPARAPKQQFPLAPCKGRGRFPAHEEDLVCLPPGSVGSILGKAMSTTDYPNTVKQTNNKQTKCGMPRVSCLTIFQYLPFSSAALPPRPIGALGIRALPKSHPTMTYPQIALGAAIACPRSQLAGHAGCRACCVSPFFSTSLFSLPAPT